MPTLVPERKVSTFYSGTSTVPKFWRGYLKKGRVHISAQRESQHRARLLSVNATLDDFRKVGLAKSWIAFLEHG